MSNRMKLLPAAITLLAGACTSIITYLLHYEVSKALWILLIVLLLFYILGSIIQKVIFGFEKQIAQEEAERAEAEGKVVEKDIPEGEGAGVQAASQGEEQQDYEDQSGYGEESGYDTGSYGDEYPEEEGYKENNT